MDFIKQVFDSEVPAAERIVIDESIMVKGQPAECGSKILSTFKSPITASVVDSLAAGGKKIAAMVKTPEFGLPGGSKAPGAVQAVASGYAPVALCNDFAGMVRQGCAESGVCYIQPTYGTVSRYGLIQLVQSMDQIGVACASVEEGFSVLQAIAGKDEKDGAMLENKSYTYEKHNKKLRINVPQNVLDSAGDSEKAALSALAQSFETLSEPLQYFDVYNQVMAILVSAELSNNISRYDGIKFGYRTENYTSLNDLYLKTRTEGFGVSTKTAAILGSLALSQDYYEKYYDKSMRIRRLIQQSLDFSKYDVIALPAFVGSSKELQNAACALASLAGLPSVTVSVGGAALHFFAKPQGESDLLSVWEVAKG